MISATQLENPTLAIGGGKTVEKGRESFFNLFANPIFQAKHNLNLFICYNKQVDIAPMLETFTKTAQKLNIELTINKV